MLVRYESQERTVVLLENDALHGLDAGVQAPTRAWVFNPLPFPRRAVVELPGAEPAAAELAGFEATTVESARATESVGAATGTPPGRCAIENDVFRIEVAADGSLDVLDKRTGRSFAGLHVFEDEADAGDLYNFCPEPGAAPWRGGAATARVLRDGPLVSELELRVQAERPATLDGPASVELMIATVVRIVRDSGRIEFRSTVDNRSADHRLRVVFCGGATDGPVRAEGQYAVLRRPLAAPPPRAAWVEPPDPTQHTLGAVALGPLVLLSKGLPEYEARTGGDLCLTLLRCVGTISQPDGMATRPLSAGPGIKTPEGQCLGRHELEYALLTDGDALDDASLLRASQDYRYGFTIRPQGPSFEPPLVLEGDVVFSCMKGAEDGDGLILRCFNPSPAPAAARVSGGSGRISVTETRFDETGERAVDDGGVQVGPHAVATLRLRAGR
jgi:hypothetical protein